ncbi:hypothetical protein KAS41_01825 [Candidatus Parcubacteria bacterium]|nr:hypothetical protein [Candidatus Parcubacteria bacterium]
MLIGFLMLFLGIWIIYPAYNFTKLRERLVIGIIVIISSVGILGVKAGNESTIGTPIQLISGVDYIPKKVGSDLAIINSKIAKLPKDFDWERGVDGFFIDKKGEIHYRDE